jgi:hypothetical protein
MKSKPDIILGIVIGMLIMFTFMKIIENGFLLNSTNHQKTQDIKTLVRQGARWSTAADQDNNAMVAVLHANYGAGYLWALKDIATDNEIKRASNIDIKKYEQDIIDIQDKSTKKMIKLCPEYAPKSSYLTNIAGEGN